MGLGVSRIEVGGRRGRTNTDFGQGEDVAILPIKGFNEIPSEFQVL
jgi:hypothetical protein